MEKQVQKLFASGYMLGAFYALVAAIAASSTGILLRSVEMADKWQVLFFRSASMAVCVLLLIIARHGRNTAHVFVAIGRCGLAGTVFVSIGFIGYLVSMTLTTVANATFLFGAAPIVTAVSARFLVGESIGRHTWLAMIVTTVGAATIVLDGIKTETEGGIAICLVAVTGYALGITFMRFGKNVDMLPVVVLSGAFSSLVAMGVSNVYAVSNHDLIVSVAMGLTSLSVQYIMITLAAHYIPAVDIALIMLTESVLSPLWVWIGVGETPSTLTIMGGVLVITAVLLQARMRSRTGHS